MEEIRVKEIVEATGGLLLCGSMTQPLQSISIDSRKVGEGSLFVPLIGERNDAHRFIGQVFEGGAAASLTSEHEVAPEGMEGVLIRVKDTRQALQDIGRYIRKRLTMPLVGITGSVGKTTTREMVAAALSAGYRTFKTKANLNSQVGVPITLSEISTRDEIAVLELGMSEPGEMEVIAEIASVDTALITNIGVTHIENLGTREAILREKLRIQDGMRDGGILILNGDNDLLKNVSAKDGCRTVYYGTGPDCDYRAEEISFQDGKPSFVFVHGTERIPIRLSVLGEHNILNALAAMAVADCYHVPLAAAAEALALCDGFQNRQQIYQADGITVIDDTYNASPDSMRAGIRVLASLKDNTKRIAVLGDMKELGEASASFHREIGAFLAEQPVDELVAFGELAEAIAEGTDGRMKTVLFAENQKDAMIRYLKEELRAGDAVLFKGSNSMKLDEAAAHFIQTGQVEA